MISSRGICRNRAGAALVAALVALVFPSASGAVVVSYAATIGYSGPAGLYAYGMDYDATDGTVLVGDYWNMRVKRFTADGKFIAIVSKRAAKDQPGGICVPYDVEADEDGNVIVADQNCSRVVVFDHNGNWIRTIGRGGTPNYPFGCGGGKMQIPTHVVKDPATDRYYVSDPRCGNIYVFDSAGVFLFEFDWSGWKTETGISKPVPRGVDQDAAGNIYVVEHFSRAVAVFDREGHYLSKFPAKTDMNDPRGIAIDRANGLLYVVAAYHNEVFQFTLGGAFVRKWGASGSTPFNSVRFPAADDSGNVWISDTWAYRVWKFDRNANPLTWATGPQPGPNGGLNYNAGVALSPDGRMFVANTYDQEIQRFIASSSCVSKKDCPAFELRFGTRSAAGANSDGFGYPQAVAFGADSVWVGDNNNNVLRWTPDGTLLLQFGSIGLKPGQFQGGVQGLEVADGKVYATSVLNCRLQIFDVDGKLLTYMGGACGSGTNEMKAPRGIAVDGNLAFVVESGNNRISVWNTDTKSATTFAPTCAGIALNAPIDVALDPAKQWLYVADTGNKRVVRMLRDGTACEVATTGADTPQASLGAPRYLDFGADGRLYVSTSTRHVYVFVG